MKKSDLKTGMWVETRKGNKYIYLEGCETKRYGVQHIFVDTDEEGFMLAENYNTDLSSLICGTWDILKIYWDKKLKVNALTLNECPPLYWERVEKSYLDDFLEKFPNAKLRVGQTPSTRVCLKGLYINEKSNCEPYYCDRSEGKPCCWDQPLGSLARKDNDK